jgi:hypothetical protein
MRAFCLGLVLLFATAAGCADLDSGGFMENYNGLPWPWLVRQAPPQSRTDTTIQHPQYAPTGRFTRQSGGATNTGSGTQTPIGQTPPAQASSGQAPAEEAPAE